jgi:hypothetical protein
MNTGQADGQRQTLRCKYGKGVKKLGIKKLILLALKPTCLSALARRLLSFFRAFVTSSDATLNY